MYKYIIFGAGQAGAMCLRLLATDCKALAFADNDESKWGSLFFGLPVLSAADALTSDADGICVAVMGEKRAEEITRQLRSMGWSGELILSRELARFDARNATTRLIAAQIAERGVEGAIAEVGVYKGEFAELMAQALPNREIHLFDTFDGFSEKDIEAERVNNYSKAQSADFSDTSAEAVRARFAEADAVYIHKGWFPDTFAGCEELRFALVSLDADLYNPTLAGLELFYDRLSSGGVIILHDYNSERFAGAGAASREFCEKRGIYAVPLGDMHGSAAIVKP